MPNPPPNDTDQDPEADPGLPNDPENPAKYRKTRNPTASRPTHDEENPPPRRSPRNKHG